MSDSTDDGQGASQDEAIGKRLEALEQGLGKLTEILEAKGKGDDDPAKEPDKPDEDDKAPGWFKRWFSGKKPDEQRSDERREAEGKGGEQQKAQEQEPVQKPPATDEAPAWAVALAEEVQGLRASLGNVDGAARSKALAGLGVPSERQQFVPIFDPHTDEGLAQAEAFIEANPFLSTVRKVQLPKADDKLIPKGGFHGADETQVGAQLGKLAAQGAEIQRRWEARNS